MILDTNDEEIKKYEVFSKEEIYNNSRVESILNANKKKMQEQSDKKVRELNLRIGELEKKSKSQEEEIKMLRIIQLEHQKQRFELAKVKEENSKACKKMESMSFQMQEYERIIKEYEQSPTH